MCIVYHMNYEFNSWRAFEATVNFIKKRHAKNYPTWDIKVPHNFIGYGWDDFAGLVSLLWDERPDDLEEMSIYGVFKFEVTKDENLNRGSGTPPEPQHL